MLREYCSYYHKSKGNLQPGYTFVNRNMAEKSLKVHYKVQNALNQTTVT